MKTTRMTPREGAILGFAELAATDKHRFQPTAAYLRGQVARAKARFRDEGRYRMVAPELEAAPPVPATLPAPPLSLRATEVPSNPFRYAPSFASLPAVSMPPAPASEIPYSGERVVRSCSTRAAKPTRAA